MRVKQTNNYRKLVLINLDSVPYTYELTYDIQNYLNLLDTCENLIKIPKDFIDVYTDKENTWIKNQNHYDKYLLSNKDQQLITWRIKIINMIIEKNNNTSLLIDPNFNYPVTAEQNMNLKKLFLKYSHIVKFSCDFCEKNLYNKLGYFCLICYHFYICKSCIKIEDHTHPMLKITLNNNFNGNYYLEKFYNNNQEIFKKLELEYNEFTKNNDNIEFTDYLKYIDKLKLD